VTRLALTAVTVFAMLLVVAGCGSTGGKGEEMTIQDLQRQVPAIDVKPSDIPTASRDKIRQSYQAFLKQSKRADLRAQAMRRLADLELTEKESKDGKSQKMPQPVDAKKAVKLYENLLKTYPHLPSNDRVLYQLGNAYALSAQPKKTLQVLDRLVNEYPQSKFLLEAHFRRAEINFSLRRYASAEKAYRKVMGFGKQTPFYLKAMFKLGWTLYQEYAYVDALDSFVQVLDQKIGTDNRYQQYSEKDPLFSVGDRELVSDTLRVISLSLYAKEKGATIADVVRKYPNKVYESLIFERLGELYTSRDRITDATNTYKLYIQLHPSHPEAVLFNIRILAVFEKGQSPLVFQAKEQFVDRFNFKTDYWKKNPNTPAVRAKVEPYLKKHLKELSKHYHAQAQSSKSLLDYQKAEKWYRLYVGQFADDKDAPGMHFLLAEALNESKQLARAAKEYESTAYRYDHHKKAAEAGYAAILAYDELQTGAKQPRRKAHWRRRAIDSSIRFADRFPQDRRAGKVLAKSALSLYEMREFSEGIAIAEKILALNPPPALALQIKAWTVIAHSHYEQDRYQDAENAYRQLLALMPPADKQRKEMQERLAASVYKQGENMRRRGNEQAAYQQFLRVSRMSPSSAIGVAAQFDAANSLLVQKQWRIADQALNLFRSRHPGHRLNRQIPEKLYSAYVQSGQWGRAAAELEHIARLKNQASQQRAVLLKAGALYEKAGQIRQSERIYKVYVKKFPRPLEQAVELRQKLADAADKRHEASARRYWLREIVKADSSAGRGRTDRTRYLAGTAAFYLAEPAFNAYTKVRLTRPLKQSMRRKKAKMKTAIQAYGKAAEFNIAEVTTASTYKIAQIYSQFGAALMKSQRPKGLKGDELEQYNLLLEERAFPFEEKAIKIHETNAKRATDGVYDEWVRKSIRALGKLMPARYAKFERSEKFVDALN